MVGNLAWFSALAAAHRDGSLLQVAALLRDESFMLGMYERRQLAELLAPQEEGAKAEARMCPIVDGRSKEWLRDYLLYQDVMSYKAQRGRKNIANADLLRIGALRGLHSVDTIRTALRKGKAVAEEQNEIDEQTRRDVEES